MDLTEREIGFVLGVRTERRRIAMALDELDAIRRHILRPSYEDQIRARVEIFENCAREFAQRNGAIYREWAGGTAAEAKSWCKQVAAQGLRSRPDSEKGPLARAPIDDSSPSHERYRIEEQCISSPRH